MFVNGLGTANPPRRYSKAECRDAFKASAWFRKLDRRSHLRTLGDLVAYVGRLIVEQRPTGAAAP